MALLFVDSCPYGNITQSTLQKWTSCGTFYQGSCTVQTSGGRAGGRWIKIEKGNVYGNYHYIEKVFGGSADTIIIQFGYQTITNDTGDIIICRLKNADGDQILLRNNNTYLEVEDGGGTQLGISSTPMDNTVWQQIEMKVYLHASAGTVTVKLNGETVIEETGLDTHYQTDATVDRVRFGYQVGNARQGFSDIIVMDDSGSYCNDFLGVRMVQLRMPTGDGTYSQFDPSNNNNNNFEMVDDTTPDDDNTYNEGNNGAKDSFTIDALSEPNVEIDAVVLSIYCNTSDGGNANMQGHVSANGNENNGPELAVPASYTWLQSPVYINPDTGNNFTGNEVGNSEWGYERTS